MKGEGRETSAEEGAGAADVQQNTPMGLRGVFKAYPLAWLVLASLLGSVAFGFVRVFWVYQQTQAATADDLLIAFGTFGRDMMLVEASRGWRRGVRTHIVVDPEAPLAYLQTQGAPFRETYSALPDWPGFPGVLRHVLTLAVAHHHHRGRYKWLLLGDDDTLWSVPSALHLLAEMGVRHTEPYMISDHLFKKVDGIHHPLTYDPRCEPCPPDTRYCPCRLVPACRINGSYHHAAEDFAIPDRHCVVWLQGGSGMIASSAALEELTAADPGLYYQVAFSNVSLYSDWIMGEAGRAAGLGYTSWITPSTPYHPTIRRMGGSWHLLPETPPHHFLHDLAAARRNCSTSVVSVHASSKRPLPEYWELYMRLAEVLAA